VPVIRSSPALPPKTKPEVNYNPRVGPILCGVDFSGQSRRALILAAALAGRLEVPLRVVTVIDPLLAEAADIEYGPGRLVTDTRRDLDAFVQAVVPEGSTVAATLANRTEVGEPSQMLLHIAAHEVVSIIVVGTEGVGWVKRMWFGSTTMRLLRAAAIPILAVPAREAPGATSADQSDPGFERILCGVDFSSASTAAARMAARLSSRLSVPMSLLHIQAPTHVKDAWKRIAASVLELQVEKARRHLDALVSELAVRPTSAEVKTGEPAEVLVEEAKVGRRALITLGLGSASHARPGATAALVLSHAASPVLAVPASATFD
jgi:nucleotide-binding universal stress UspA family protein